MKHQEDILIMWIYDDLHIVQYINRRSSKAGGSSPLQYLLLGI